MYTGIDPGKKGAIVKINSRGRVWMYTMPLLSNGDVDLDKLCKLISKLRTRYVCLESIHSLYAQSKGSAFTMGRVWGNCEAAVICKGHHLDYVRPMDWQSKIWIPEDVVKTPEGKNDTKASSLRAARRLYPRLDLRYGQNEIVHKGRQRSIPHDGIVDALLIAHYCKLIKA